MQSNNRVLALGWGLSFGCFLKQLEPFLRARNHELSVIGVFDDRCFFQHSYIPLETLYSDQLACISQERLSDLTRFETILLTKANYKFEGLKLGTKPSLDNLHLYARRLYHGMQKLISGIQPKQILCHGYGGYPTEILRSLGAQYGIRTWHFEHACFPGTIQMDSRGVNACSSLASAPLPLTLSSHAAKRLREYEDGNTPSLRPSLAADYSHFTANPRPFPLYPFSLYRGGVISRFVDVWVRRYLFYTRSVRLQKECKLLPDRFIFAPLQVHDDSQVVLYSSWIGSIEEWLHLLTETCPPDVPLVIKLHPADRSRVSYRRIVREILRTRPDFLFISELDVKQLISQCLGVVTINSTVGFEALLQRKPVIAAGDSFWTRASTCYKPQNNLELQHLLTLMASARLNEAQQFSNTRLLLSHAFDTCFPDGSFVSLSDSEAETIVDRILKEEYA